ncbi:NCS2 family permease [Thermodesulfobacterium sp. TA1]|uniref:NCS2 family permease n=1 Tax=Thermodesulfobacterium sp. TA1 TaxID=2234087 RepID=UPI0012318859|nr:NCS2 family permease [Thermodesulfobacterium sp. TA1]QER41502.1 NCS2 family permease [Thermodesulfobacterium sp. TA1]
MWQNLVRRIFNLDKKNTNVKTEFIAGFTTFMTMAYVLAVVPSLLSKTGMPKEPLFTSVALMCMFSTFLMGVYANLPFALAPGIGLCAFFTYTVVLGMGYSWQTALTAVFLEGIIFIFLTVTNLRTAIAKAIPENLKKAVSVGIGLFIAFIGLQNAHIVVKNPNVLVQLGDLTQAEAILGLIGIILTGVLLFFRIKGALLLGILITAALGIPLGITRLDGFQLISFPSSLSSVFFKFDFSQFFSGNFLIIVLTFLSIDLFDTIGTLIGVSTKAKLEERFGEGISFKRGLLVDAIGTTLGAMFGVSTVTAYIESASGVAEGGRTGLTSVFTAFFFLLALFFSSLFLSIPLCAITPALVLVGLFMLTTIKEIDFEDLTEGLPAFLTIMFMPLTFSIVNGIIIGVLSYVGLKLLSGRIKEVPFPTLLIALFFIAKLWVGF